MIILEIVQVSLEQSMAKYLQYLAAACELAKFNRAVCA